MPARDVKAYVKRNQNDAADAERVQENPRLVPPLAEHLENGHAASVATDGLAIDEEGRGPERPRCGHDCREALGPIIAAAGEQPHARGVAADHGPVAIKLDLMKPIGAARRLAGR
jgi:hypothetical protein